VSTAEAAPTAGRTFPFEGSSHKGPSPIFRRLRAEAPVTRVAMAGGGHAWLVTRHADIRRVLGDERFSRSACYAPGAPAFEGLFQAPPGMIISLDPPEHTRLRGLAMRAFSTARIEAIRPRIRELVTELLGPLAECSPADLMSGFAAPLAIAVIGELLGVPATERPRFAGWIRRFADVRGPEAEAVEARERLGAYMADLVRATQTAPGPGVLSALVTARDGADRLSTEELIGLGYTLLGAGADSTASQLANFVLVLLADHRDVWRRLGTHPEEVPTAVEELLRMVNLNADDTSGLPRIATVDVTIGGVTVPAGDAVFLAFPSANRDESIFPDADRPCFDRTPNPHLAFGYGAHRCLGAQLARLEIAVALEELTRTYPDARLAASEADLRWEVGDVNHRLAALPVLLAG